MDLISKNNFKLNRILAHSLLGIFIIFLGFYFFFLKIPNDFPVGVMIKIEKGDNLRDVSFLLKEKKVIKSRLAFEAFAILYGGEKALKYSDYFLEKKLPVYEMARRVVRGDHHLSLITITIPEGFTLNQIAETVALKLINFNKNNFLTIASSFEGNLFPDTYLFFLNANETDVLKALNDNFNKKIKTVRSLIDEAGKTEKEIVVMASILEKESKGEVDRDIISGILWKRIKLGMPLQVDAVPETYKIKGLPEKPIANPGLATIKSAINPVSSPYLYYLHDKSGMVYYAKSFTEHNKNIQKYLR